MLKSIITFTVLCSIVHCTDRVSETHAPGTTASYVTNKEYHAPLRYLDGYKFSFPKPVPGSEEERIHPLLRRNSQASTQNGHPDDSDELTVTINPAQRPTESQIQDIIERAEIKRRKNTDSSRSSTLDFENTNRLPMNDNSIVKQSDEVSTQPTLQRTHSSSLLGTGEKPILPRRVSDLRERSLSTPRVRQHNTPARPSYLGRSHTIPETADSNQFHATTPSFREAPEDHRDSQDTENAKNASECSHDDSGLSLKEPDTLGGPIKVYNQIDGSMLRRWRAHYRLTEGAAECTGASRPDPLSAVPEHTDDDDGFPNHRNEANLHGPHALTALGQQILQGESKGSSESKPGRVSSSSQRRKDVAISDFLRSLYEKFKISGSRLTLLTLGSKKSTTSLEPDDEYANLVKKKRERARLKRKSSTNLEKLSCFGSTEMLCF